jgi:hypothetical protein
VIVGEAIVVDENRHNAATFRRAREFHQLPGNTKPTDAIWIPRMATMKLAMEKIHIPAAQRTVKAMLGLPHDVVVSLCHEAPEMIAQSAPPTSIYYRANADQVRVSPCVTILPRLLPDTVRLQSICSRYP